MCVCVCVCLLLNTGKTISLELTPKTSCEGEENRKRLAGSTEKKLHTHKQIDMYIHVYIQD